MSKFSGRQRREVFGERSLDDCAFVVSKINKSLQHVGELGVPIFAEAAKRGTADDA
jgi:hypothetical protein